MDRRHGESILCDIKVRFGYSCAHESSNQIARGLFIVFAEA